MAAKQKRPSQIERPLVERDQRAVQRERDMAAALRGVTSSRIVRGPGARGRARSVFQ